MSMPGVSRLLQVLAVLTCVPLNVPAIDTCDAACQDKDFLESSCYGEVCALFQPVYDRGALPETKEESEVLQVRSGR